MLLKRCALKNHMKNQGTLGRGAKSQLHDALYMFLSCTCDIYISMQKSSVLLTADKPNPTPITQSHALRCCRKADSIVSEVIYCVICAHKWVTKYPETYGIGRMK